MIPVTCRPVSSPDSEVRVSRRASGSSGGGRAGQRQNSAPQPRGKKAAAGPKKPVKQPLKMPTSKQMQTVPCPACNAPDGEPCTLRGGHQARVAAFRLRAADGLPAAPKNQRKRQKAGSQGELPEQLKISRSDSPRSPALRSKGIVSRSASCPRVHHRRARSARSRSARGTPWTAPPMESWHMLDA
ncbi:zinc finger domain-containing protein [Streptomyces mirabilis]